MTPSTGYTILGVLIVTMVAAMTIGVVVDPKPAEPAITVETNEEGEIIWTMEHDSFVEVFVAKKEVEREPPVLIGYTATDSTGELLIEMRIDHIDANAEANWILSRARDYPEFKFRELTQQAD